MRAGALLAWILLAGCIGADPPPPESGCRSGCARIVDDGPERAFEPDVAIAPQAEGHWLVASGVLPDRGPASFPEYLKYHVSVDAGATWTHARFPGEVAADHPLRAYTIMGDPAVAFLPDGAALYAGMGAQARLEGADQGVLPPFRPFDVFVARSTDGGRTWPAATVLARGEGTMGPVPPVGLVLAGVWQDQPWLATGTGSAALATWTKKEAQGGPSTNTLLARASTDGGVTWGPERALREGGSSGSGRPALDEAGTFWVAFRDDALEDSPLWLASSADGEAWSSRAIEPVRLWWHFDLATSEGILYVVATVPPDGRERETVRLHWSADAGATWRALDVDTSEAPGHALPRVAAHGSGALVTYYHARQDGATEHRAAFVATDGAIERVTLSRAPIGPSDDTGGWPTFGDYVGLDATPAGAVAAWIGGARPHFDVHAAALDWPGD